MDSLMELISSNENVFAEMALGLQNIELEEARVFRTKGKGGLVKKDGYKGHKGGVIRYHKGHKGLAIHTKSEHKSHGVGSFCRTHSHPTCRR